MLMALIVVAGTTLLATHHIGQSVTRATVVVNAADAAAYSAGTWTARRMNLLAYTNRALIANHIAVGHLVAYISWLRYVDAAVARIRNYSAYIPYVGPAVQRGREAARKARLTAERVGGGMIQGIDGLIDLYSGLQLDLRSEILPPQLISIMGQVARRYDEALDVNDPDAVLDLPTPYREGIGALLTGWSSAMLLRLDAARPGSDRRYFTNLLSRSIASDRHLSRWLRGRERFGPPRYGTGGRRWSDRVLFLIRLRKQGPTNRARVPSAGGWRSADRLQVSFWDPRKLDWKSWATVARGRASTTTIAGAYRGVISYHRLAKRGEADYAFHIPALVTHREKPDSEADDSPLLHAQLSRAEVRYRRPDSCRRDRNCPRESDAANLFNPYWEASLVSATDLEL